MTQSLAASDNIKKLTLNPIDQVYSADEVVDLRELIEHLTREKSGLEKKLKIKEEEVDVLRERIRAKENENRCLDSEVKFLSSQFEESIKETDFLWEKVIGFLHLPEEPKMPLEEKKNKKRSKGAFLDKVENFQNKKLNRDKHILEINQKQQVYLKKLFHKKKIAAKREIVTHIAPVNDSDDFSIMGEPAKEEEIKSPPTRKIVLKRKRQVEEEDINNRDTKKR